MRPSCRREGRQPGGAGQGETAWSPSALEAGQGANLGGGRRTRPVASSSCQHGGGRQGEQPACWLSWRRRRPWTREGHGWQPGACCRSCRPGSSARPGRQCAAASGALRVKFLFPCQISQRTRHVSGGAGPGGQGPQAPRAGLGFTPGVTPAWAAARRH
jgi:hypothetical protein